MEQFGRFGASTVNKGLDVMQNYIQAIFMCFSEDNDYFSISGTQVDTALQVEFP